MIYIWIDKNQADHLAPCGSWGKWKFSLSPKRTLRLPYVLLVEVTFSKFSLFFSVTITDWHVEQFQKLEVPPKEDKHISS